MDYDSVTFFQFLHILPFYFFLPYYTEQDLKAREEQTFVKDQIGRKPTILV